MGTGKGPDRNLVNAGDLTLTCANKSAAKPCRRRVVDSSISNDPIADDPLAELAEILAAGLMRLKARKSSPLSGPDGESLLGCAGDRSAHADGSGLQGRRS